MVRGPRCVVDGRSSSSSFSSSFRDVVSVLESDVDVGVVVVADRSVVTGGLVEVIVAVVVAVVDAAGSENDGSTKFSGASSGLSNWCATKEPASTSRPIARMPSRLAPITAGVRLCHGCSSDESSS